MRKAKIVCTLGPASATREMIEQLARAGMNVARLNFSHGTHSEHKRTFDLVRATGGAENRPIAILADLQGPKIRVGCFAGGAVSLTVGDPVVLVAEEGLGDERRILHTYAPLAADARAHDRILLDDGRLELEVNRVSGAEVHCTVVTGGVLSDHKGMNLPGVHLSTPALTAKDKADLAFAASLGVEYVAISFVRHPDDVAQAKALAGPIPVIAKIEKPEAVLDFARILEVTDGIMVARGDLGVELGPERVPLIQKQLIEQTNAAGKLVITATDMLDSMREHPRPTRAEASDVANAILDGTDAVMLSGETAAGKYPVEAVRTMDAIIRAIESSPRFRSLPDRPSVRHRETTNAVARAAVVAARELGATAILCYTESGASVALISEYRPEADIIAVTSCPPLYRQLALHWGVHPIQSDHTLSTDETIERMTSAARDQGLVQTGDTVVVVMGSRADGASDVMKIHRV